MYEDIAGSGRLRVATDADVALSSAKEEAEAKGILDQWPFMEPPPAELLLAGYGLDPERATGLPAVLAIFRIVTGAAGMVPIKVYRGENSEVREEARDTWQWNRLHKRPAIGSRTLTPFAFKADYAAQMIGHGECFIRKVKPLSSPISRNAPTVLELRTLADASSVEIDDSGVRRVYKDGSDLSQGRPREYGDDEIIHVRGFSFDGKRGVSPIGQVRESITLALQRQSFERRFVQNDARPPAMISFPREVTEDQARAWLDVWNAQHQGPRNAGKIGVIGGGAQLSSVPLGDMDALFVEATKLSIHQVAGIYSVPAAFLAGHDRVPSEQEWQFLVTFGLGPIFAPLDQALAADEDLFPDGSDLFPESLPDALVKYDILTEYQAYRLARQGGWMTPNEIRLKKNLKPKEGGDAIQETPVGGAQNQAPKNDGGDEDEKEKDDEKLRERFAAELAAELRLKGAEVDEDAIADAIGLMRPFD